MNRFAITVCAWMLACVSFAAPQEDGHENNGGNLVVVQFISTARDIHNYLVTNSGSDQILGSADLTRLINTINHTRVEPVIEGLTDRFGQRADAVVEDDDKVPGQKKIRIWEPAWRQYLKGPITRGVYILIFHEYLRVMGFNEDQEPISSRLTMSSGSLPRISTDPINMSFETQGRTPTDMPMGWWSVGDKSFSVTRDVVNSVDGRSAIKIAHNVPTNFGGIGQCILADSIRNHHLTLSGELKTLGVVGLAGLWLRIDGFAGSVLFLDNMMNRNISGTLNWQSYETVETLVPATATYICFGAILDGAGTVWADKLKLKAY